MLKNTLEVTILWGDTILDRVHAWRDRPTRIGELQVLEKRGTHAIVRVAGSNEVALVDAARPLEVAIDRITYVVRMVDARAEMGSDRTIAADRDPRKVGLLAHLFGLKGDGVLKVLQSLVFDKPKGGGIVVVMYPFIFEST